MQAQKKLSPNKEGFTREIPVLLQVFIRKTPVLLQGFTREKIDIILRLGCEKPCETLYYLGIIPHLDTLTRTIPYLNTLNRTIPYLNTLTRIHSYFGNSSHQPIRIEYYVTRVVSQSESSNTSLGSQ